VDPSGGGTKMSYDLYFKKSDISSEEFFNYFHNEKNYTIDKNQVLYENNNTGVYFVIDYYEEKNDDNYFASLNLNYYRPLSFGYETALVIDKFIKQNNIDIFDPQNEGMGEGPFTIDGFIRSWQHGNDFGYQSILEHPDSCGDVYCESNDQLWKIWNWNYKKEEYYEELQKDIFIPTISFALVNNVLSTFVVWPDAISTIIPKVDYVLIMRKELGPKKFFRKTQDQFFVTFDSLNTNMKNYQSQFKGFIVYDLPCPETPLILKEYVKKINPIENHVKMIAPDSILSSELVKKFNRNNNIIEHLASSNKCNDESLP
jgi:hypothetical protein